MKRLLADAVGFPVALALSVTGCSAQTAQLVLAPASMPLLEPMPEAASEIVQDMVARMNTGDGEGSLIFFADNAVAYNIGLPPTGMEVYAG